MVQSCAHAVCCCQRDLRQAWLCCVGHSRHQVPCRSLLQDLGVTAASRYSRTRESLRPDARYKAMPKAAREPAFKQYVAELQVRAPVRG